MNGRVANEGDTDRVLDMVRDFFAGEGIAYDREAIASAFRAFLRDPNLGAPWVFEEDGQIIGYAMVSYGYDLEFGGRDAWLTDLYVVPESQSRGVGKAALAMIEREAKRAGVNALHLHVDPAKTAAHRLYKSANYTPSHRISMTKRL